MTKAQTIIYLLVIALAIGQLFHGLSTGKVFSSGYNFSERQWNRASKESEPVAYWFYILVHIVIIGIMLAFVLGIFPN